MVLLAELRGESIEETYRKFKNQINIIPLTFSKHTRNLLSVDFSDAGIREGMPFVRLPNGRTFFGHFSDNNHRSACECLKDLLSPVLTAATYWTVLDVSRRYLTDYFWIPKELQPASGGTQVEGCAYLGHITIRFADEIVCEAGHVMAIEMMPGSLDMLRRNIDISGLSNCIDIAGCDVWNEQKDPVTTGKGRQRNSLLSLENRYISSHDGLPDQ